MKFLSGDASLPAAVVLALALAGAGCDRADLGKRFAELETGMSREEVHEVLGKPDEVVGGSGADRDAGFGSVTELWYLGTRTIAVQYVNDKVRLKTLEPKPPAPIVPLNDPAEDHEPRPGPGTPEAGPRDGSQRRDVPEGFGPPGRPTDLEGDLNTDAS